MHKLCFGSGAKRIPRQVSLKMFSDTQTSHYIYNDIPLYRCICMQKQCLGPRKASSKVHIKIVITRSTHMHKEFVVFFFCLKGFCPQNVSLHRRTQPTPGHVSWLDGRLVKIAHELQSLNRISEQIWAVISFVSKSYDCVCCSWGIINGNSRRNWCIFKIMDKKSKVIKYLSFFF